MTSRRNLGRATFGRWLFCFALAWSLPATSWAASVTAKYDGRIEAAVGRWWPHLPFWKLGKAQLMAESGLDPTVCSAVGACGLAQFMPATWPEMVKALNLGAVSPHDADAAIQAYAYFQGKLDWQWRKNRQPLEAHWLGTASYNRGLGNIIKDQAECGGARLWPAIVPCTLKHTDEPVNYNIHIETYWKRLELTQ